MAQIKPFLGICPRPGLAGRIAALPYDVYSRQEAKAEVAREPLSFLKIDRAETLLGDEVDMYAPEVYQKAGEVLRSMIADGSFQKETEPCYYIYELTMEGRVQTGLVACSSVDDYLSGVIARHENTRADKEEDRIRHVQACDAQTGPIFLAYRENKKIREDIEAAKQGEPMFDFTSPDGIRHRGFRISDAKRVEDITRDFRGIPRTYIADGHHRAASAVKVSLKLREEAEKRRETADGEYDYFLSVLFASDELYIMDYNRIVADLNGNTVEEFKEKLSEKWEIRENSAPAHICEGGVCRMEMENAPFHPQRKGQVGMYLDGLWYALTYRAARPEDPVNGLDVSVLQNEVLQPILGIQDPRTDQRIAFAGGIRGLAELQRRVDESGGVAFAMYPTSMEELFAVADAHLLMPPKSTWFEPKLRSGLFLHALH